MLINTNKIFVFPKCRTLSRCQQLYYFAQPSINSEAMVTRTSNSGKLRKTRNRESIQRTQLVICFFMCCMQTCFLQQLDCLFVFFLYRDTCVYNFSGVLWVSTMLIHLQVRCLIRQFQKSFWPLAIHTACGKKCFEVRSMRDRIYWPRTHIP